MPRGRDCPKTRGSVKRFSPAVFGRRPRRRIDATSIFLLTGFDPAVELHRAEVFLDVSGTFRGQATASCVQAARAARDPERHRSYFQFVEIAGWLLAAVHLRGLLERRQPPIEHAEIAGYGAVAIAARRYTPRD